MLDYYVVSKSQWVRIYCDGPVTAEIEKSKLQESMKAAGYPLDVEIELHTKLFSRASASAGHKRNTKLRYK